MLFPFFSRRYWSIIFGCFLLPALFIAGCGETPPNSKSTSKATATSTKSNPEWDKVIEAAKREGKLSISAPSGNVWRKAILEPWKKAYPEIEIEYSAHSGRDYYSKVFQEQKIGQYNWDLRIGGPNQAAFQRLDAFEPIKPILQPDLLKDEVWFQGLDGFWADKKREYFPTWLVRVNALVHVNRDKAPDFNSLKQLTDPKYKGKIVLQAPDEGAGLGSLATMLHAYGDDFLKDLLGKQEVVVLDDARMIAEQLVRGKYALGIGVNDYHLKTFKDQGLGKKVEPLLDGPLALSIGSGSIQLMKNAPHPNASKLFINWLLSKEAQEQITQIAEDYNSRRTDVKAVNPELAIDPKRMDQLFAHQIEENLDIRGRAQKIAKEFVR